MNAINNALETITSTNNAATRATGKAHITEMANYAGLSADLVTVAVMATMEMASEDLDLEKGNSRTRVRMTASPDFSIESFEDGLLIRGFQKAFYRGGRAIYGLKTIAID